MRPVLAWIAVALLGVGLPGIGLAAPRDVDRRLEPSRVSPLPSQVRRVEPAVVGIRVEVEPDRSSAATLGTERWGSGVIFDAEQGYVLTVSYVLLGGAALVDSAGQVIGVTSLRLGEAPHVNLAIPIEKLLAGRDELVARGRVTSRPPRPWLGLYTESGSDGAVICLSPLGPAQAEGRRPGDVIVQVSGRQVASREDFYRTLWQALVDQDVHVTVERPGGRRAITCARWIATVCIELPTGRLASK